MSTHPDNEQSSELREQIHELTWEWIQQNVDSHLGFVNWTNGHNRLTDFVVSLIAQHTKEAVLKARIDELERLYRVAHRGNFYDAEILYRIAELSAPQQSKETSNE